MSLNKITNIYLELANELISKFPSKREQIDLLFHSLRELTDNILYEDKKANNNRYPYYEKNIKVQSIVVKCKAIIDDCKNEKANVQDILDKLNDVYVLLKWFQWYITDAKRSIKSIIKLIENNEHVKRI